MATKPKTLTTKTDDREKIAIYLDNDQIAALRKIQVADGVPIAEQIRRAVTAYLERRK